MSKVRKAVDRVLAQRGLAIRRVPLRASFERGLTDLLRATEVEAVIDVGANTGQFGVLLRSECGFTGTIVSVEPTPAEVERLRATSAGDPRWHVEAVAISAMGGPQTLHQFGDSQFNSLLDASPEGVDYNATLGRPTDVAVPSITLADLLTTCEPLDGVALDRVVLKLDTQGYDLHILRSAPEVLDGIAAVAMEVPLIELYEGSFTLDETLEVLRHHGLEVWGTYPNSFDRTGAVADLNLLARRRRPIDRS